MKGRFSFTVMNKENKSLTLTIYLDYTTLSPAGKLNMQYGPNPSSSVLTHWHMQVWGYCCADSHQLHWYENSGHQATVLRSLATWAMQLKYYPETRYSCPCLHALVHPTLAWCSRSLEAQFIWVLSQTKGINIYQAGFSHGATGMPPWRRADFLWAERAQLWPNVIPNLLPELKQERKLAIFFHGNVIKKHTF